MSFQKKDSLEMSNRAHRRLMWKHSKRGDRDSQIKRKYHLSVLKNQKNTGKVVSKDGRVSIWNKIVSRHKQY